jgi:hypothetical protein
VAGRGARRAISFIESLVEAKSMRRAILPMSALLMAASLAGCSESGASGGPPPGATVGQIGPPETAMPPGAADAMKKSLQTKPKKTSNSPPGQVPH